jgi:hypothetical protein
MGELVPPRVVSAHGPTIRRQAWKVLGISNAHVVAAVTFDVEVAGTAALLVSKAHKIHDRLASKRPERAEDKDASDVYRLMQTSAPDEVGDTLAQLQRDEIAGPVTTAAVGYLTNLFGRRQGRGSPDGEPRTSNRGA